MRPRRRSEPPPAAPVPVIRGEWRTLPPIQRVLAVHPLTNPVQRFTGSLASWHNPSYLAPLGHLVSPVEPAGVADLARPVPTAPAGDLPVVTEPTTQRRGLVSTLWSGVVQRSTGTVAGAPPPHPAPSEQPAPVAPVPAAVTGAMAAAYPDPAGPDAVPLGLPGPAGLDMDGPGITRPVELPRVFGTRPVQRLRASEPSAGSSSGPTPPTQVQPGPPGDLPLPIHADPPAPEAGAGAAAGANPHVGPGEPAGAESSASPEAPPGLSNSVAVQRLSAVPPPAPGTPAPVRSAFPVGVFTTAPDVPLPSLVLPTVVEPVPVQQEREELPVDADHSPQVLDADSSRQVLGADALPPSTAHPSIVEPLLPLRAGSLRPEFEPTAQAESASPQPNPGRPVVQRNVATHPAAARDAVQGDAVQQGATQRDVVQGDGDVVRRNAVERGVVHRDVVQQGAVQRDVVQGDVVPHGDIAPSAVQPSAVLPIVVQPSAVQRGGVQLGAVQAPVVGLTVAGLPRPRRLGLGPPIEPTALASGSEPDGPTGPALLETAATVPVPMLQRQIPDLPTVTRPPHEEHEEFVVTAPLVGSVEPGRVERGGGGPGGVEPGGAGGVEPGGAGRWPGGSPVARVATALETPTPAPRPTVSRLIGERPIAASPAAPWPVATPEPQQPSMARSGTAWSPTAWNPTAGNPPRTESVQLEPTLRLETPPPFVQRQSATVAQLKAASPAAAVPTVPAIPFVTPSGNATAAAGPAAVPAPVPVIARVESAADPGVTTPAAPPASAGGEPEELVARIYDPLLRRLKADLRLDRERRGVLTDQWH